MNYEQKRNLDNKYIRYYKGNFSIITWQDIYYDGFSNDFELEDGWDKEEYESEDEYWETMNNEAREDEYLLKLMQGKISRIR